MASNINALDIDEAFPVAGQDNDSQGFRDNFNIIKGGLSTAKTEITDLQTNTAKLNAENNFNQNIIRHANFISTTSDVYPIGNIIHSTNINWSNGLYQTVQVGADVTLTLTEWPDTGVVGKLRIVVTGDGLTGGDPVRTITWAASLGNNIRYDGNFPDPCTVQYTTVPKIFDFWSSDGGLTVYAHYIGEFT